MGVFVGATPNTCPTTIVDLPTIDLPFSYASQTYTVGVDSVLEVVAPTFTSAD